MLIVLFIFNRDQNFKDSAKGLLAATFFYLSILASTVSVQLLERRIPDFELNAFRSVVPVVPWTILVSVLLFTVFYVICSGIT